MNSAVLNSDCRDLHVRFVRRIASQSVRVHIVIRDREDALLLEKWFRFFRTPGTSVEEMLEPVSSATKRRTSSPAAAAASPATAGRASPMAAVAADAVTDVRMMLVTPETSDRRRCSAATAAPCRRCQTSGEWCPDVGGCLRLWCLRCLWTVAFSCD